MVIVKDNFLNPELFAWLSDIAIKKADVGLTAANKFYNKTAPMAYSLSKFYTINQEENKKSGWDMSFGAHLKGDLTEPKIRLGKQVESIVSKISDTINNATSKEISDIESVYMLFSATGYSLPKHVDIGSSRTTIDQAQQIFRAFLFCHKEWSPNWGGELCFESKKCLPIPNRLVIYTMEEPHWVNSVTKSAKNYRIIFATSYGKEQAVYAR